MDSEIDSMKEEKLKTLLGQLEAERGILERIVYKNKNQHRRSSYFQRLLKVRRDLRLLQSANLEELLSSCFQVIAGKRPKQKVHLLESLKRRKYDVGKPNFMERLLGAARLLSQIVETMLRAATEVSTLLARSFFMGFSLTVLALLARLRVLVQQILLDIVPVFNTVSSLSQRKHSVKITHEGIEVYREFYPKKEDYVTLECVWNTDKFVLAERMNKCEIEMPEGDNGGEVSVGNNAVRYQSIESFLGDDEPTTEKSDTERLTHMKDSMTNLLTDTSIEGEDRRQVEKIAEKVDTTVNTECPSKNTSQDRVLADTGTSASFGSSKVMPGARKVAFVSVKGPVSSTANPIDHPSKAAASTMNPTGLPSEETGKSEGDKTDAFYSLLTRGNYKDSLFG
ncbi:Uncharacterized protein TCM_030972 isoform 1 [Theobroma cacao]|uniref:Uncharacterized protein isoform 1 n=2 Tax=Theobroma cacao TaxID=3641 RepID=A0A061F5Z0_THECC|nr:Uncharacterized protein TCM_030972 isoform 1 [Theobroma cacao]